jgi:hypothetical protein
MIESNLKLSEKQEEDLIEYAFQRVESLEQDNRDRIESDRLSWKTYENDRGDRVGHDNIYSHSNVPVPMTTLVVDHFLARAEDEITGTSPFFKFAPQGPSDDVSAEEYDKYFNWKLETVGHTRERLEESYLHIFLQRACIMKAVYDRRTSTWQDHERNALFNNIEQDFEELPGYGPVIEGVANFFEDVDIETGQPSVRLQDDPSFKMEPGVHEFKAYPKGVPTQQVVYDGAKSVVIDSDRFLCPSDVESIHHANFVAELYDKPLTWARDMYLEREWSDFATFSNKVSKDANKRTNREEDGYRREDLSFDNSKNPQIKVIECWITRDVLGTGEPQQFCLFLEPETKTAIYYEYVAKVTPDNRLPYSVVSIGRQRNKWWGPSLPERIKVYQEFIDKQFNSEAYRNELTANPIVGANLQAVEDEPDDIELLPGKIFELKDGNTADDFISYVQLPNADAKTQQMIDFVFGMVQLWLGVSNMAQGDYQALAPANTATGVEATLREASKIGRRWMRRIVKGFEDHISKLVKITATVLDQEEVYEYMEGEVKAFGKMSPEYIKKMDIDVAVILSQDQGQRAIEKANLALQTQQRFFESPPEMRPYIRPMLKRILDALGYEKTDELLPEDAPPDPRQEAEMMKLMSDGAGAPSQSGANTEGMASVMGNSNPQGANQFQQQA